MNDSQSRNNQALFSHTGLQELKSMVHVISCTSNCLRYTAVHLKSRARKKSVRCSVHAERAPEKLNVNILLTLNIYFNEILVWLTFICVFSSVCRSIECSEISCGCWLRWKLTNFQTIMADLFINKLALCFRA